jgi:ubiquinone/menaquinone biosynthesis C-methylase UbiE
VEDSITIEMDITGGVTDLSSRTADGWAAFFLPHLGTGMRLLDCGCGPGTITAGLAEAVARG